MMYTLRIRQKLSSHFLFGYLILGLISASIQAKPVHPDKEPKEGYPIQKVMKINGKFYYVEVALTKNKKAFATIKNVREGDKWVKPDESDHKISGTVLKHNFKTGEYFEFKFDEKGDGQAIAQRVKIPMTNTLYLYRYPLKEDGSYDDNPRLIKRFVIEREMESIRGQIAAKKRLPQNRNVPTHVYQTDFARTVGESVRGMINANFPASSLEPRTILADAGIPKATVKLKDGGPNTPQPKGNLIQGREDTKAPAIVLLRSTDQIAEYKRQGYSHPELARIAGVQESLEREGEREFVDQFTQDAYANLESGNLGEAAMESSPKEYLRTTKEAAKKLAEIRKVTAADHIIPNVVMVVDMSREAQAGNAEQQILFSQAPYLAGNLAEQKLKEEYGGFAQNQVQKYSRGQPIWLGRRKVEKGVRDGKQEAKNQVYDEIRNGIEVAKLEQQLEARKSILEVDDNAFSVVESKTGAEGQQDKLAIVVMTSPSEVENAKSYLGKNGEAITLFTNEGKFHKFNIDDSKIPLAIALEFLSRITRHYRDGDLTEANLEKSLDELGILKNTSGQYVFVGNRDLPVWIEKDLIEQAKALSDSNQLTQSSLNQIVQGLEEKYGKELMDQRLTPEQKKISRQTYQTYEQAFETLEKITKDSGLKEQLERMAKRIKEASESLKPHAADNQETPTGSAGESHARPSSR